MARKCWGGLFFLLVVCVELLVVADRVDAQDLGHKLPGLIGLEAGKVPPPGLYLIDRLVSYEADELRDRRGTLIPVADLQLLGRSNAVGLSYTIQLPRRTTSFTMTAAAPLARLRLNIHDRPEASFDRFGLADIYIQPALLGWRLERVDLVASYGLYLPTGTSSLAGGNAPTSTTASRTAARPINAALGSQRIETNPLGLLVGMAILRSIGCERHSDVKMLAQVRMIAATAASWRFVRKRRTLSQLS